MLPSSVGPRSRRGRSNPGGVPSPPFRPWRKALHAGAGLVLAGILLLWDPPRTPFLGLLAGIAATLFLLETIRLRVGTVNRAVMRLFRVLASPGEEARISSATWYAVGCLLAVAVFPERIAAPAILVLAVADPAAAWVGGRVGRRRIGTGTLQGSAAFLACAVLVLLPFAGPGTAVAAALAATVVELLAWPLDDNVAVPAVAGTVLWSLAPLGW